MRNIKYAVAALSVIALIGVSGIWYSAKKNSSSVVVRESSEVPFVQMAYSPPSSSPVDFEKASERAIASVVHIKTTRKFSRASNSQGEGDPFNDEFLKHFFGDNGGKGFSMPEQKASGSGVIVGADGYIVTNHHVVENASEIMVTIPESNKNYKATVVGTDPNTDLALVKIDAKDIPVMTFANSDEVKLGQWVLAVGYPLNLDVTVTQGIVSGKSRNIGINRQGNAPVEVFIQTDAAINPGSSGGALVNTNGELVGVNAAIASPTGSYAGYAYSIPSNLVKKVVTDIMKFGTVQRGYLGIQYAPGELSEEQIKEFDVTDDVAGVLVMDVDPKGAAAEAGMKKGDIIVKINGQTTATAPEMVGTIAGFKPGDKIQITYQRNKKENTCDITLKNRSGNYGIVKPSESAVLGLGLSEFTKEDRDQYAVDEGVKVDDIREGIVANQTDMKPGFLITRVAGKNVRNLEDFNKALETVKGNFQIEGVYPGNSEVYYYGINGFKK